MTARSWGGAFVASLFLGACAGPHPAAAPDDLDVGVVARFEDASALAADPSGTLYVADVEAGHVVLVSPAGVRLGVVGGAGTADGALVEVADVDPTNGQAIFVADAGAGAVVHYTAERRAVASIAIPEAVQAAREAAPREVARGRPVAVARGPGESLYVADADRGVVLRLDGRRVVDQVLGERGDGALVEPVSLAVDTDGRVYVADRGRGVVQTFDAFGAPGHAIDAAAVGDLASVRLAGRRLVVAGTEAVALVDRAGGVVPIPGIEASEPFVGAVLTSAGLFVLTPTRLARLGAE